VVKNRLSMIAALATAPFWVSLHIERQQAAEYMERLRHGLPDASGLRGGIGYVGYVPLVPFGARPFTWLMVALGFAAVPLATSLAKSGFNPFTSAKPRLAYFDQHQRNETSTGAEPTFRPQSRLPRFLTLQGHKSHNRLRYRAQRASPDGVSWWMGYLVTAVLVVVGRLLFPNVDLRRNVFAIAVLIIWCLVIQNVVAKYLSRRR
jgi:hypothetical protein